MNNRQQRRLGLLVILLIITAIVGRVIYLDLSARQRFAQVKEVVAQIQPPPGSTVLSADGTGDGLSAHLCIDTHCPSYSRTYVVALAPGDEQPQLLRLLETAGHRVTTTSGEAACADRSACYVESVSDDLLVTAGFQFPNSPQADWVPERMPPPGTQWRWLTISASDY